MRSALGRPIDIRYASNRYVIFVTLAAGAVGLLASLGDGVGNAIGSGLVAGGAAFLAWAVARELDPDRVLASYLAAPAGLALWFFDAPGLLITGAVLLAIRSVVRTTGYPVLVGDVAFLVAYAAITGLRPGGVLGAAALGVVVVGDTLVAGRSRPAVYYAGGLAVVVAAVATSVVWADAFGFTTITLGAAVLIGLAIAGATLTPLGDVRSVGDYSGRPLDPRRVRAGRMLAVALAAGYLVYGGSDGLTTVGPLLAAMAVLPLSARYDARTAVSRVSR